jgi:hypothetical protein
MEQIKLVEVLGDVEQDNGSEAGEKEIRTLKDLELVLVGGGDGQPCW